ncbi:DNA polymerase epsilon subunit 4-like [Stegodyphus dumicola]|uniref:DNA polymerase epsilon subunit 4-like n=1 Tax=Stegodyphus dumicola TaxID=202533 RepID=UPI0015B0E654|nr:DNA polymerase epsilon subunit 4-like [Stegodyphus dumicola]
MEVEEGFDTSETIIVDDVPLDNNHTNVVEDFSESVETIVSSSKTRVDNLTEGKGPEKIEKLVQLPLTRIKNLIKLDPDVNLASHDAVFVIAKAAELFIYMMGREAYKFTKQNKKKTIQKKDIDDCISACDCLAFLEGSLKDD